MGERARAMVLACFAADSLALGAHWIYSTEKIVKLFGRVEHLLKPSPGSYHQTKDRGAFTHYGDQTFVLLESIAANKGFDLNDFARRWQELFLEYTGYRDQASRQTMANFSQGMSPLDSGSSMNDLAGASRIAPIVYCYRERMDELVSAVRSQTAMTHNDPLAIDMAEFFARTIHAVFAGESPTKAIESVTARHYLKTQISKGVDAGLMSLEDDTIAVIREFGQNCHLPEAIPGVIHLISKYEDNLKEALIQSVMAGGDSAARGMIVGMVLGAHLGLDALPDEWISSMTKTGQIRSLLDQIGSS